MKIDIIAKWLSLTGYQKFLLILIAILIPLPVYLLFGFGYASLMQLAMTSFGYLFSFAIIIVPFMVIYLFAYIFIIYKLLTMFSVLLVNIKNTRLSQSIKSIVVLIVIFVSLLPVYSPIQESDNYSNLNVFGLYAHYFMQIINR